MLALITDYGNDIYVGIMKVVMKEVCDKEIVDINHYVKPFSVVAGAYNTLVAFEHLPRGSVLVVVVDPGVGTERRPIIVKSQGKYLVGPDNGVFQFVIERYGMEGAWEIKKKLVKYESYTFHGRDIFGPTGAFLACGGRPEEVGERLNKVNMPFKLIDEFDGSCLRSSVIYVDRFGNVTLWARELPFKVGERVTIRNRTEFKAVVGRTFSDVNVGEMVVYKNSFGFVEIAVNQGSAKEVLGVNEEEVVEICKEREW